MCNTPAWAIHTAEGHREMIMSEISDSHGDDYVSEVLNLSIIRAMMMEGS
jgi:hypothetical protein